MSRIFLISIVALTVSLQASAQKKNEVPLPPPQLPIDNVTRKITYEEVVEVPGATADQMYKRISAWFHTYFKNPGEVIRENDSLKHSMTGKPRFRLSNPPDKEGTRSDAGLVQYTITVAAKDGRFKFELTDFNWKQPSYYPCEKWFDSALPSYTKSMDEYLRQTDNYAKSAIADLKNAVSSEKAVKNKDDW